MIKHNDEQDFADEQSSGGNESGDVMAMLKKIQKHLGFLETKIDTLLEQSRQGGNRPPRREFGGGGGFSQNRDFRKPSFGGGQGGFGGRRDSRGGGQDRQDRPWRKPGMGSGQGGFPPKKHFGGARPPRRNRDE